MQVDYKDPWQLPFTRRLADLRAGTRHVAYYYDVPDNSTFRYRCYNMVQALSAMPELAIGASWFAAADLAHMDLFLAAADVLVICRVRYDTRVAGLIARARAHGTRVVYDIDDLVFDAKYVHLVMDTLDIDLDRENEWNHWFAYIGRLGATLRMCDAAIGTNLFLAKRLEAFSGLPVGIVPNFFNREQWDISERIHKSKTVRGRERDDVRILGYFSGSPSHNRDFELISGPVARLLDDDPLLQVRLVGYLDLKGPLSRHLDRVEFVPFQDFVNLQRLIGDVDVNLVPLQDNIFTNCKSELKYFEAALVDTVTIATPTYTFHDAIKHGETGWLCAAQDWEHLLRSVMSEPELRRDVAARARIHAGQRYSWTEQAICIQRAIFHETNKTG